MYNYRRISHLKLLQTIEKRDGTIVEFKLDKIVKAIAKAGNETKEFDIEKAERLALEVGKLLKESENEQIKLSVEGVQDLVEFVLLDSEYKATAKAYILYRERQSQARRPNIFKHRLNLKPYEYPQLIGYKEAIQHSYWLHTEFNYTSDIQDFEVNASEKERNAIKNAMLAIAQVEVAVKRFWGDLYHRMPKPEVDDVGSTFAGNEVIHQDAYAHLLEILGMNEEFERITKIPELYQRVDYLSKSAKLAKTGDNRDFALSLILFSLFIEHVSLFSQFLIIMSFNKHKNLFKGISNVIEATSKEEQIHGLFGVELINIIRDENPEWFNVDLEREIIEACMEAYRSEEVVIDWIYEKGDLDFMPKNVVKEFVKSRLNDSLVNIGYKPVFSIDDKLVEQTDWYSDELATSKHVDFFVKRSVNYSKRTRSITGGDLF